ncbi:MAG TPA: hypothetical protein VFH80_28350 [Solirubrobacteraceae bacterium]|nr:hypothetical protein [Solirubrobacteraceae bacterium]
MPRLRAATASQPPEEVLALVRAAEDQLDAAIFLTGAFAVVSSSRG